jgi:CRP-like cAMP-binding protein
MNSSSEAKIAEFFSKYPKRTYDKGQILIHAGDEPQYVWFIVEGKVRQYDISYRGDEIVVNVFKPGAYFPMLWAITKLPNRYFFGAETKLVARVVPYEDALTFLKNNSDVMFDLLSRLYTGIDGLLGRMAHLMAGSAKSRLMYELIIECQRFGDLKKNGSCLISINETVLASRTGLSRETVSREMRKLVQNDLVNISQKGIAVNSISALQKRLGTEL